MAQRQEQEPARSDITEVAPGVLRMELPIHMPGLGHVNCYALIDSDGAAIVDPGLPGPASWRALQLRFRQAGLRVRDVHTVIVTHSHPDHFGGASRLAKESGAKIVAHAEFGFVPWGSRPDDPEVSVDDLAAGRSEAQEGSETGEKSEAPADEVNPSTSWKSLKTSPWGGRGMRPPLRSRIRWRLMRWRGGGDFVPEISHPVQQGDTLSLAGREWFVLHTPGHTTDHICLHDPATGLFLAGDHVLPTITPHISGAGLDPDPLKSFMHSLDQVAAIPQVKNIFPAHGHPFSNLSARVEAIKRHHHERLERVKEIGRELGSATVEQFSKKLFRPRSWGGMAESETFAHLEHLRLAGEAERRTGDRELFIYETG